MSLNVGNSDLMVQPRFRQRLLAPVRFQDAFTGELVRVPLLVKIPLLRLVGIRHAADSAYCFVCSHEDLPGGVFRIEVEAPGGEYLLQNPLELKLPVEKLPIPADLRDRFLVDAQLHPTRRLLVRPGETSVVGQIHRSAPPGSTSNLQVRLIRQLPGAPLETRTDAAGEFFFRVPPPPVLVGGVPAVTEAVAFEVRQQVPGVSVPVLLSVPGGQPATITAGQANIVPIVL